MPNGKSDDVEIAFVGNHLGGVESPSQKLQLICEYD